MRVAFEDPADESGLCNLLKVVAGNAHKADTKSYRRVPVLINNAVEGRIRQRSHKIRHHQLRLPLVWRYVRSLCPRGRTAGATELPNRMRSTLAACVRPQQCDRRRSGSYATPTMRSSLLRGRDEMSVGPELALQRHRAPGREFDRRLQSIARCWSYRSSVIASNRLQKRLRPRAFWVQLCRSLRGLLSLSAVPSGYNASGDSRNASASRHAVPWSRHPPPRSA